jgi:hypothetical protein
LFIEEILSSKINVIIPFNYVSSYQILGRNDKGRGGGEREMEKERPKSLFTLREVAACFMVQKLFYIIL